MDIEFINYPSSIFIKNTQNKMDNLKDFSVRVNNKFSKLILKKAVDCWPRTSNDTDRVRSKRQGYLYLSMLFFPKLWFVNSSAICSGYIMNYDFNGFDIILFYSYK